MKKDDTKFPIYVATLSHKGGSYSFHISELGIIASGPDVETAYRALQQKKQAVLDEFHAAGLSDELPIPSAAAIVPAKNEYRGFALRTLIVAVAALVVVSATMMGARSVITTTIDAVKIKSGGIHLKLLEDKLIATLHATADPRNEYSAEKRDKLIESLRTIVKRYKPFVDEVRPLISGDTDAASSHPTKEN